MRLHCTICLWLTLMTLPAPPGLGEGGAEGATLLTRTLHVGDADVLGFDGMTTAATGDPAVADVVPLSTRRLLVNAKGEGRTTLLVLDRHGRHRVQIVVTAADGGLNTAAAQIQVDIGLASVSVRAIRGVIFLEGTVPTEEASRRAEAIAGVYAAKVKNLLTVAPDRPQKSLAETYAALINETWGGKGIAARVMDTQTVALTGTYTPPPIEAAEAAPPEPAETDDLTGPGDAPPRRRRARTEPAGPNALDRMLATLPAALSVVNLVQTGGRPVQQILVRAKVIDIQRDAVKELGVHWGTLAFNTSRGGDAYVLQSQPILFGQSPGDLYNNPFSGGGPLKRLAPLAASLTALITENKARVLSEPSLLVCRVSVPPKTPGRKNTSVMTRSPSRRGTTFSTTVATMSRLTAPGTLGEVSTCQASSSACRVRAAPSGAAAFPRPASRTDRDSAPRRPSMSLRRAARSANTAA